MNGKKILMVEDEPLYVKTYKDPLEKAGFEVFHAANGEDALKLLSSQKFDLIIADLLMPIMSGQTFLRELKNLNSTIPIVVLTTLEGETDREDVLAGGAKTMLFKTTTTAEELVNEVNKYI